MRLRVLTLNVWNDNPPVERRMRSLEAWLSDHHPDAVALQEVTGTPRATQAHRLAAAAGYDRVHFDRTGGQRGRSFGLAVLTDLPAAPLDPVELPRADRDETRILQQVELTVGPGALRLANTHLAWRPTQTASRVRQAAAVARALDDCPDPVLLVGDLNDVHDSPPLRELAEAGDLADRCDDDRPTFAAANPWTWQPALLDRRVDHALARGPVAVRSAIVVLDGGQDPVVSDHYGVRITLEL